jgi:hypothetical protein
MEGLDANGLSERLRWEDNEYWLHLEADTPFEKYPGKPWRRAKIAYRANVAQQNNMRGGCKRSWVLKKA